MAPYGAEYEFKPIYENPVILDFTDCKYIEDVHLLIKHKFGLPDFCGENWDAVLDLLEDVCYSQEEPLLVEMRNFHQMPKAMQKYCDGMFFVFDFIEKNFPQVSFKKLS